MADEPVAQAWMRRAGDVPRRRGEGAVDESNGEEDKERANDLWRVADKQVEDGAGSIRHVVWQELERVRVVERQAY